MQIIERNLQSSLIKNCIILTNDIGDFKKQRYSGLTEKSNKRKTWNITQKGRKKKFRETGSQLNTCE
jgi:hypothetical protein